MRGVFEVEEEAAEAVLEAGGEAVGGEEGGGARGEVDVAEGHGGRRDCDGWGGWGMGNGRWEIVKLLDVE